MTEILTDTRTSSTLFTDSVSSLSAGRLSNHLLNNDPHYYRSRLFNSHIGINPLIAAASPLLLLATNIAATSTLLDVHTLSQQLKHEIKAFENNARAQHYRTETILITRYLLCTLLDEFILHHCTATNRNEWCPYLLLHFFHQEQDGGERFFLILERAANDPHLYIDLLELIYVCLNLGYQGKFRLAPQAGEQLNLLRNRLFDCINIERGDLKKELSVHAPPNTTAPVAPLSIPVWIIGCFTAAVVLTIYSSFSYLLGTSAAALYQQVLSLLSHLPLHIAL